MKGPLNFPDEPGMLGHPGWFLGDAPLLQMGETGYYPFGYSLFLVAPFAVLSDPAALYTAAMVVNAFLLAALFPLLYVVLRRIMGTATVPALLGAAAGSVYPSVLFAGNWAWAEPAAVLVFPALLLAAWLVLTDRPSWQRVLLGPTAAFAYAVHTRFSGVVAVTALLLVAALWARRAPRRVALTNLVLLVVGLALVTWINDLLFAARWTADDPVIVRSPVELAKILLDPGEWRDLVAMAAGQAWYLAAATFGLFVAGVTAVGARVRPLAARARSAWSAAPTSAWVAAFALLAAVAVFVISVTFMTANQHRADHLVYGRYNEAFLPLFLAIGTAALATKRSARRLLVLVGTAVVVIVALAVAQRLLRNPDWFAATTNWPTITGVFWQATRWPFDDSGYFIPRVTLIAAGGACVLGFVAWRLPRVAAALAIAAFATAGLVAFHDLLPDEVDHWYGDWTFPEQVESLDLDEVAFDTSTDCWPCLWRDQWFLPGLPFEPFDSAGGEDPSTDAVIAPIDWERADELGARLAVPDGRNAQGLWILPGDKADELDAGSRLLPAGFPSALPDSALRSDVHLDLDCDDAGSCGPGGSGGSTYEYDVVVGHAGSGSPWVNFDSYGLPGLVRVHVRVVDETDTVVVDATAELPEFMLPGDEVRVTVPLALVDSTGAPLEPGDYTLEIGLTQEGFRDFDEVGGPAYSERFPVV